MLSNFEKPAENSDFFIDSENSLMLNMAEQTGLKQQNKQFCEVCNDTAAGKLGSMATECTLLLAIHICTN